MSESKFFNEKYIFSRQKRAKENKIKRRHYIPYIASYLFNSIHPMMKGPVALGSLSRIGSFT